MALAYDTSTGSNTASGSSLTWSHTCTGSNLILHVFVHVATNTDVLTGITYNGVAMTRVGSAFLPSNLNEYIYMYELVAPATGANNVVVSLSGAQNIRAISISHTGAKQTSQPDASATGQSGSAGTSYSHSLTTLSDQCWIIEGIMNDTGAALDGTNYKQRFQQGTSGTNIGDTNAAISPAGSTAQVPQAGSSSNWASIQVSILPAALTSSGGTFLLNFV